MARSHLPGRGRAPVMARSHAASTGFAPGHPSEPSAMYPIRTSGPLEAIDAAQLRPTGDGSDGWVMPPGTASDGSKPSTRSTTEPSGSFAPRPPPARPIPTSGRDARGHSGRGARRAGRQVVLARVAWCEWSAPGVAGSSSAGRSDEPGNAAGGQRFASSAGTKLLRGGCREQLRPSESASSSFGLKDSCACSESFGGVAAGCRVPRLSATLQRLAGKRTGALWLLCLLAAGESRTMSPLKHHQLSSISCACTRRREYRRGFLWADHRVIGALRELRPARRSSREFPL